MLIKATAYQGNKFRNPVTLNVLIWWFGMAFLFFIVKVCFCWSLLAANLVP